jgi:uncharacterized protein (TIGR01244 family)
MKHVLTILAAAALAACAATPKSDAPAAAAAPAPVSAFEKAVARDRVIVAGQPTLDDLKSLKERGIVHVFNVRGVEEMNPESIGFDEAAELAALGIGYSNHPIDKAEAYTPALLEAFAKQVEASNGKLLLHCTVGARASQVYAAYAMKYLDYTPDQAARTLEAVGSWPLALERLTGERLALVHRDDLSKLGIED